MWVVIGVLVFVASVSAIARGAFSAGVAIGARNQRNASTLADSQHLLSSRQSGYRAGKIDAYRKVAEVAKREMSELED